MTEKQKTISKEVSISGKGLHTGAEVNLKFKPAKENTGYNFVRTDLEERVVIPAVAENVIDTSRGTTIGKKNVKISTIEHLMASVYSLGIDNIEIEIDGEEIPILDGSAELFVNKLLEAGIIEQEKEKKYFEVEELIEYADDEKGINIQIFPDKKLSLDVLVSYPSKHLNNQYAKLSDVKNFKEEIAKCRTFVFVSELQVLLKNNLIKGGDIDNAIIIVDKDFSKDEIKEIANLFDKPSVDVLPQGILNNIKLHFDNESARHKLLDLLGDLALVGYPVKGKIIASKPGHKSNTEFAKKLRTIIKKQIDIPKYDERKKPIYDINAIKKMLPHRPPFLLVDKIIEISDKHVVGVKNVTMNETFFQGHFPDEPVMPAVLQIEAMAQAGGILMLSTLPDPEKYTTYFLKMDKIKFRQKVVPGDTLVFKLELLAPIRRGIVYMFGQGFVGGNLVIEGELMALVTK